MLKLMMIACYVFVHFFSVDSQCVRYNAIPQADYYWREYYGSIPEDAIVAGVDITGNFTYVGQILIPSISGAVPAVIYPGRRAAEGVFGKSVQQDKYVKILCSTKQDKLLWLPVTLDDFPFLTNYHLVVGGFEVGEYLYIGRVNYKNSVIVGKVFDKYAQFKGLRIAAPTGEELVFTHFELLVYRK